MSTEEIPKDIALDEATDSQYPGTDVGYESSDSLEDKTNGANGHSANDGPNRSPQRVSPSGARLVHEDSFGPAVHKSTKGYIRKIESPRESPPPVTFLQPRKSNESTGARRPSVNEAEEIVVPSTTKVSLTKPAAREVEIMREGRKERPSIESEMDTPSSRPSVLDGHWLGTSGPDDTHDEFTPLTFGSYITLFDDMQSGYVCIESLVVPRVTLQRGEYGRKSPVLTDFRSCVFQVQVPNKYTAAQALHNAVEDFAMKKDANKIKMETTKAKLKTITYRDRKLRQAQKASEDEDQANILEQARLSGKAVVYGDVVELKHMNSGSYLYVAADETAHFNNEAMLIGLTDKNNLSTRFRIMPRYKLRSEGENVRAGDQVVLESVRVPGSYIHTSWSTFEDFSNGLEIDLASEAQPFRIAPYFFMTEHQGSALRALQSGSEIIDRRKWAMQLESHFFYNGDSSLTLRSGDVIRIFHKEREAYVCADADAHSIKPHTNVHLRCQSQRDPTVAHKQPRGASVFWQLEIVSATTSAKRLSWSDAVRLRHFPSRLYLSVSANSKPRLSPNPDETTQFQLHPISLDPDASASGIGTNHVVRIRHIHTDRWLHGSSRNYSKHRPRHSSDAIKNMKRNLADTDMTFLDWDHAELKELQSTESQNYLDAFILDSVDRELVLDNTYLMSAAPPIKHFLSNRKHNKCMCTKEAYSMIRLFDVIVEFTNSLKAKRRHRQKIMRHVHLLDLLVKILRAFFKESPDPKEFEKAENAVVRQLAARAVATLSKTIESSNKSKMYLARHLGFFKRLVPLDIGAGELMGKIVDNNRGILDRIDDKIISYFVDDVTEHCNPHSIDFLGRLCLCNGLAIERNQEAIVSHLLINQRADPLVITHKDNFVTHLPKSIRKLLDGDEDSPSFKTESCSFGKFMTYVHDKHPRIFRYHVETVRLFANLCASRNHFAIETITQDLNYAPWFDAFLCVTDEDAPYALRTAYVNLLQHAFVNVSPNTNVLTERSNCFVVSELEDKAKKMKEDWNSAVLAAPSLLPGTDHGREVANEELYIDLREWITSYLVDRGAGVVVNENDANRFMHSVLSLLHQLISFGVVCEMRDMKRLITPVSRILNSSHDRPSKDVTDHELLHEWSAIEQFNPEYPGNSEVIDMRLTAMNVAKAMFELRARAQMDLFLMAYFHVCETIELPSASHEEDSEEWMYFHGVIEEFTKMYAVIKDNSGIILCDDADQRKRTEALRCCKMADDLNAILSQLLRFAEFVEEEDEILQNLFRIGRYKKANVKTEVLKLLYAQNFQIESVLTQGDEYLMCLLDPTAISLQRYIRKNIPLVKRALNSKLTEEDEQELHKYVGTLEHLFVDTPTEYEEHDFMYCDREVAKNIVRSNGVIFDLAALINRPIDLTLLSVYKSQLQFAKASLRLLSAISALDDGIQRQLFKRLEWVIHLQGMNPELSDAISVLFAGNLELCLTVSDHVIGMIVDKAADTHYFGYLNVLRMVANANGRIHIRRNQYSIVKNMLRRRHDIFNLFKKEYTKTRMNLLLHTSEANPNETPFTPAPEESPESPMLGEGRFSSIRSGGISSLRVDSSASGRKTMLGMMTRPTMSSRQDSTHSSASSEAGSDAVEDFQELYGEAFTSETQLRKTEGATHEARELRKLKFHLAAVGLLATCAKGENRFIESVVTGLVELEDVLDVLCHPEIPPECKIPYFQLMRWAFLESAVDADDTGLADLQENPKFWRLVSGINGEGGQFAEAFTDMTALLDEKGPDAPECLERFYFLATNWEEFDSEILPLLASYFTHSFRAERANDVALATIEAFLVGTVRVMRTVEEALNHPGLVNFYKKLLSKAISIPKDFPVDTLQMQRIAQEFAHPDKIRGIALLCELIIEIAYKDNEEMLPITIGSPESDVALIRQIVKEDPASLMSLCHRIGVNPAVARKSLDHIHKFMSFSCGYGDVESDSDDSSLNTYQTQTSLEELTEQQSRAEKFVPMCMRRNSSITNLIVRNPKYAEREDRLNESLLFDRKLLAKCCAGPNMLKHQLNLPSRQELMKKFGPLQIPKDGIIPYVPREETLPLGEEFRRFVSIFRVWDKDNKYLHIPQEASILVEMLQSTQHLERKGPDSEKESKVALRCLHVIRALIHNELAATRAFKDPDHRGELWATVERVQNDLVTLQVPKMLIKHTRFRPTDESFEATLTLLALLEGGNRTVQEALLHEWHMSRVEPFFEDTKDALMRTKKLIRDHRMLEAIQHQLDCNQSHDPFPVNHTHTHGVGHLNLHDRQISRAQQIEDLLQIHRTVHHSSNKNHKHIHIVRHTDHDSLCGTDAGEARPASEGEIELYMKDRITLRIIQLLCEGHFEGLQDYLRTQADNFKNINLVVIIVSYVTEHSDEINTWTYALLTQAFETLIEFCQGNEENQITVFDAKILDPILQIIARPLDPVQLDVETLMAEARIKHSCAKLLLSMVESNTTASRRLAQDLSLLLPLKLVFRAMAMFKDAADTIEDQDKALKKSFIEMGFSLYVLQLRIRELGATYALEIDDGHHHNEFDEIDHDDEDSEHASKLRKDMRALTPQIRNKLVDCGLIKPSKNLNKELKPMKPMSKEEVNAESESTAEGQSQKHVHKTARNTLSHYQDVIRFFEKRSASVEIIIDDTLQVIHFLAIRSNLLTGRMKDELLWSVDRSSPSDKIRDFVLKSKEVENDMLYLEFLQGNKFTRFFVGHVNAWGRSMTLVSFLINLIFLCTWQAPEDMFDPRPITPDWYHPVVFALGIPHLILCIFIEIEYVLSRRRFRMWYRARMDAMRSFELKTMFLEGVLELLTDFGFMYHFSCVVLSLMGLVVNPAFYCWHLTHIVHNNDLLRRVIQAVTKNGRSLLLVAFLTIVVTYMYSVWMFSVFRSIIDYTSGMRCATLGECFVSSISYGVRSGGGLGEQLYPPSDQGIDTMRVVFDLSFFVIVSVIGLNIVFGIIVDTFQELRDEKWRVQEDMEGRCFVCSIRSYEFERQARGFEYHVKKEHNMWGYLLLFIHIKDKDPQEYTAHESYVAESLESGIEERLFPINRALSIPEQAEDHDQRLEHLERILTHITSPTIVRPAQ
eukprot:Clim_evm22s25 gene=Clim_evmTU22s25